MLNWRIDDYKRWRDQPPEFRRFKLLKHIASAHAGKVEDTCPACKELQEQKTKKLYVRRKGDRP
jgi:hypothetical protein